MNYWLLKSDPETYGWDDLVKEKSTAWTGVRNFQARNNLSLMKVGDKGLFYHSLDDKAIVGTVEITKAAYPDPTAKDGAWVCVEIKPLKKWKAPVTLAAIKADPAFKDFSLLRQSQLSVMPADVAMWKRLEKMGGAA